MNNHISVLLKLFNKSSRVSLEKVLNSNKNKGFNCIINLANFINHPTIYKVNLITILMITIN